MWKRATDSITKRSDQDRADLEIILFPDHGAALFFPVGRRRVDFAVSLFDSDLLIIIT